MGKLVNLDNLNVGQGAVIEGFKDIELRKAKRLVELGFVKGTKIVLIKRTKDVFLVGIRGFSMALDKKIANQIYCVEV